METSETPPAEAGGFFSYANNLRVAFGDRQSIPKQKLGGLTWQTKITSFNDLEVYRTSYDSMLQVMKDVITKLPESEKYDLKDQLSRACKAIPRLIAEGYAKKHQKMGFQKYIDDAMAECNEMIVSLSQCRDIYSKFINIELCRQMIDNYDKTARQLYKLSIAWTSFKRRSIQEPRIM